LLIVVAIIAILAAIAVPNFLEAQTRSKVSRTKSDIRSLATAIEAYAVDHSKYPREWSTATYGDPLDPKGNAISGVIWWGLSTPVSYITSPLIVDVFQDKNLTSPYDERVFTYHDMKKRAELYSTSTFWPPAYAYYGAWRLGSVGPDRSYSHVCTATNTAQLVYDPTNGTISPGNIWRSQREPVCTTPPVGPLNGCN
jgi:type II secretory pathway pseudopilin PulG